VGEIANDVDALESAVRRAMQADDKPSLIVLRSHIGYPSPNFTDSAKAHGSPLGEEEIRRTKEILGLPPDETFWVPDEVLDYYRECISRGRAEREAWEKRLASWTGDRAAFDACLEGRGLPGWHEKLPSWSAGDSVATRHAIKACFDATLDVVPGLLAGGADLTENTGTELDGQVAQSAAHPEGRQLYFGVREHGMGGTLNGMAMHGGVVPAGGTFFVFSDYMRGAVRLAAISEAHVLFVWSHDSVGLGEDGPTHQPVEHLASLRAMPGLRVIRPADANETAHAYRIAIESNGPTGLILSRQKLPVLEGTAARAADVARGAYVLRDADDPDIVLIGTGSEVSVCVGAADLLAGEGVTARVVSMPSWELFDGQDPDYQDAVLSDALPTLAVEAASSFGWERYADASVSIDRFGASAPGNVVLEKLGFTPENVAAEARALLADLEEEEDD
jgi:transketolase